MKFFVYANKSNVKQTQVKDGRVLYFVPENKMREWAGKFDPSIMEFCGVSIEAANQDEAKRAFLVPLELDGFDKMFVEQEPLVTRHYTERHNQSKASISKATMDLMVNRLATLWQQIDELLRGMAQLYVLQHGDMTEKEAYTKMKREWLARYKDM